MECVCEFFAITVYADNASLFWLHPQLVAAEENLCDAELQMRLISEDDRWSGCTVCVRTAALKFNAVRHPAQY